jgi:hypothetical protein
MPVPGASRQAYTLTVADVGSLIEVRETAFNAFGSATADSTTTPAISHAPITLQAYALVSTTRGLLSGPIAQFTEPGIQATPPTDYTARIDWGDHASSTGRVRRAQSGSYLIDARHVYRAAGSYNISVEIKAKAGATARDTNRVSVFTATICPKGISAGRNCLGQLALPTGCVIPGRPLDISIPSPSNIATVRYTIDHSSLGVVGVGRRKTAQIGTTGLRSGTHHLTAHITFRTGEPRKLSRTRPFAIC